MPAIDVTPSTTFSKPDVSLGISEFGSVVVVVGATVVVVVVVGGLVVVVVGATVVVVVVVGGLVVVVVGIVVSMSIDSAKLCGESLPALSVTTAVTDHVPSVRVANSHEVATAVS
jgi:hypothetical protein